MSASLTTRPPRRPWLSLEVRDARPLWQRLASAAIGGAGGTLVGAAIPIPGGVPAAIYVSTGVAATAVCAIAWELLRWRTLRADERARIAPARAREVVR